MKSTLFLLAILLVPHSLRAEQIQTETPEKSLLIASTSVSSLRGGNGKEGRSARKEASQSEESALSKALELPASDIFALDDPPENTADFELQLPEESLPQSDIPLTVNNKVEYFIRYFQTSGRKVFAKWLSRSERYIPMMKQILNKEGLPEDLVYLAMIESGFSPHAYSVASAVGPWQFISGTGKRYSLRIDPWIDERRDPIKSTVAAAMYLKELYSLFNKDWYLAAAGYNAGENKILRAMDMYNSRDFWQLTQGTYLKRETKDYVPKLLAAAIIAKDPARYGFADVAYLPPIDFDTVVIPSRTDLALVAGLTGVPLQNIRELNPALRQSCTPPNYPGYELKLPKGKRDVFLRGFAKISEDKRFEEKRFEEKIAYRRYRVGRKDTLASISRRFGVKPAEIVALNRLGNTRKLRGKVLVLPSNPDAVVASSAVNRASVEASRKAAKEFVKYYTVKKGDTIHAVAKRFNVSAKIIAAWNNLKGRMTLNPGKRIIVAKFIEKNGSMVRQGDGNG